MSHAMKLSDIGELSLLDAIRKRFAAPRGKVLMGIGDDTAVVRPSRRKLLLTTDMMVEKVHFDLSWTTPYQLGFKLISANVSDIYAMGGDPAFVLLDIAVPGHTRMQTIDLFFDGIEKALESYRVSLVGGDVSASEKMVVAATLVGYADRAVRRNGARTGDRIYVSGCLGDAACGLRLMRKIGRPVAIEKDGRASLPLPWSIVSPLLKRHLLAEVRRPGSVRMSATAMMDISDGLLIDLSRLCRESGVGALLFEEQIPLSRELIAVSKYLGLSSLELALSGGEDYELLYTVPRAKKVRGICIGEITDRALKIRFKDGRTRSITARGYQHFAV